MAREETELDPNQRVLKVRSASVVIHEGPDAGKNARLAGTTTVVGSGDTADIVLTDTTVSREHVRLVLSSSGLALRDEWSKNGTWIGALRVRDAILTGDTAVRIGATTFSVRLDAVASELELSREPRFGHALGFSPAMRHLFALLERAAASEETVLLEGESGVGKEVLARAIHDKSPRAAGPFVAIDCGAIPAALIESELFGHARGSFTGAAGERIGLFEQAAGGTVFLDELGELPLDLQPRLLRALEAREVRPVGSNRARPLDVRIVAATNRNLDEQVRRGAFRQDLFYRLAVVRARVPALRDRPEDIVPLATAFLRNLTREPAAELPSDFAAMLMLYRWPGNVRELGNVVRRYSALGSTSRSELFDGAPGHAGAVAQAEIPDESLDQLTFHDARKVVLDRFERTYLQRVLVRAGGVVSRAAELAGVARPSLHRMMRRLELVDED